jgi:hypothetical protein
MAPTAQPKVGQSLLNGGNLDSEGEFKIAQKLAETCIASK